MRTIKRSKNKNKKRRKIENKIHHKNTTVSSSFIHGAKSVPKEVSLKGGAGLAQFMSMVLKTHSVNFLSLAAEV